MIIKSSRAQRTGVAVFGLLLFSFSLIAEARAQDCNPTVGDDVYSWVSNSAPRLSRELAKADYDARTFNFLITSFDDIQGRITNEAALLDAIATRMHDQEQSFAQLSPVDAAIKREHDSQDVLDQLFALQQVLLDIEYRAQLATAPLSQTDFTNNGLQNIGRETLIASLDQLGDSAASSLTGRYSFFLSITTDEEGNFKSAQATPTVGMYDTLALIAASYLGPEGYACYVFAKLIQFGFSEEECNKKIQHQKERLDDAFRLLPEKLITPEEQYALYSSSYSSAFGLFAGQSARLNDAQKALQKRWASLMSYNALRNSAAHKVLTASVVNSLAQQYGSNDHITNILNSEAISTLATNVASVNSYISNNQISLLTACANTAGYEIDEKQSDALEYANEADQALLKQSTLAPLHTFLNSSLTQLDVIRREQDGFHNHAALRLCNSPVLDSTAKTQSVRLRDLSSKVQTTKIVRQAAVAARSHVLAAEAMSIRAADSIRTDNDGSVFCSLHYSPGGSYTCDGSSPGTSYDDQFSHNGGTPQGDVLFGANDGGFAADNRRVSTDINQASANISARVADLESRTGAARSGMTAWNATNAGVALQLTASVNSKRVQDDTDRANFSAAVGPDLHDAEAMLTTFLRSPLDSASVSLMLNTIGAVDFSLPSLRGDQLPPDAPRIAGISVFDRVYPGESDPLAQAISRERTKVQASLTSDANNKKTAASALDLAEKFATSVSVAGRSNARNLLEDSEGIRYREDGRISDPTISQLTESGEVVRVPWKSWPDVPSASLISHGLRFSASSMAFAQRFDSVSSDIAANPTNQQQRTLVAQSASEMAKIAEATFYAGDVRTGERLLVMAHSVLDIASRFVPGVNLGRDVYEAVTGRDLFTNQTLDVAGRTLAIVGVLTLGFEDEVEGGVKALRALGESVEEDAEISKAVGVVEENKLNHIFGNPEHDLSGVTQEFGSQEAAYQEILKATQSATAGLEDGVFEVVVQVGGSRITVRGAIVDGITKIGTAFIP